MDTKHPFPLTQLPTYTVATLPTAANYPACLIYVSNGSAGSPCVAMSDGTNWKVIATIGSTCAES